MNIFKSYGSYSVFEQAVREKNRFIHDSAVKDFLKTVLETGKSRVEKVREGGILWRSQLGHDWEPHYEGDEHIADVPSPFFHKRMKPLKDSACEGRANPKGIPYLYLSTDKNTSMAEVRPWIASYISVGRFKLLRDVRLINCTINNRRKPFIYFKEPPPQEREIAVWGDIDEAFSRPVTPNDSIADYVPTQILAELFKNNGFDGIAYRSSLGKGHNIVLFDLNAADLIKCALHQAKEISFSFSQVSNPYFVRKYYKKNNV